MQCMMLCFSSHISMWTCSYVIHSIQTWSGFYNVHVCSVTRLYPNFCRAKPCPSPAPVSLKPPPVSYTKFQSNRVYFWVSKVIFGQGLHCTSYYALYHFLRVYTCTSCRTSVSIEVREAPYYCYACLPSAVISGMHDTLISLCLQGYCCPRCKSLYCIDCDIFIHETLHYCPGCTQQ